MWGLAVSAAAEAPFSFYEPVQPPRPFQVMVHRGSAAQAPENTRPALELCAEDGFEWAEVDVRLTKDGHHVLSHGDRLEAGANQSPAVSEHTLEELKRVDLGAGFAAKYKGERLLSLAECLAFAKGRINLYLDCKAVNPEKLVADILEAGMERQTVVYDSPANARKINELSRGRVATMTKWRPKNGIKDWVEANKLAAVEIDADEITAEAARAFHELGVKVQVKALGPWDRPEFWDKSIAAGADWIQTDLPEELLARALWQRVKARPARFSLHRGASRYAPENTLPAFGKALRLGANFVEFDVRTTADGQLFLLHDSALDRTTDGHGPIQSATADAVRALSAGVKFGRPFADTRLPSLDEFLAAMEGKVDLYFDAKAIAPEALAEAVARHHMAERTVVYQSVPYLLRLKALDPRIRAMPGLGSPDDLQGIFDKLKPHAVDAKWKILSKELIARCHALGIRVFSDALGEHERVEDFLQAMDWGIDLIQTDHPMRFLRAVELRAGRAR